MQERQYQDKHIDDTIDAIERFRCVLSQMPTGGGKTVEFSKIVQKFLRNLIDVNPGPTLILVHREELLKQTAKAIKEVLGFEPCLITSSTSRYYISRCYIGMVESTLPRIHMIVKPSLIIIDECHIQNFNKIHEEFKDTKIIGFSATPISSSKKDPLNKYYHEIIVGPSIKDLINLGYLSQNITIAPKVSVDASQFSYDRLKGDYNESQMSGVFQMSNNITNVVDKYFEYCLGKKTLIFNVNIEHSKKVNECFIACGFNSRHLDASSSNRPSKDPRCKNEREEIFLWFKETEDAVLNSVMIPTMGFDEPTVQSVILNYSTMSLAKFIQTCGRGSRIIDDYYIEKFQHDYPYILKTKNYFHIIDLGQNWKRFGDWNDERDWRSIFYNPDKAGEGIAPVKTCPSCEGLVHAAVRVCPLINKMGEICNHEFQRREVQQMDIEEMILVTKGIDVDALVENSGKKYKYYGFAELAIDVVDNMFFIHGSNPSKTIVERFFRQYYSLCIEWYNKTLAHNKDEIGDISDSGWHIKKAKNNFNSLIIKKNKDAATITQEIPYDLAKQDQGSLAIEEKKLEGIQKE